MRLNGRQCSRMGTSIQTGGQGLEKRYESASFLLKKIKTIRKNIKKSIDNNTIKYYNVFKDKENKYRMKG